MKKNLLWIVILFIGICGFVSCEKDAEILPDVEIEDGITRGSGGTVYTPKLTLTAAKRTCYEGETIPFTASVSDGYVLQRDIVSIGSRPGDIVQVQRWPTWDVYLGEYIYGMNWYAKIKTIENDLAPRITFSNSGSHAISFSSPARKGDIVLYLTSNDMEIDVIARNGQKVQNRINVYFEWNYYTKQYNLWAESQHSAPYFDADGRPEVPWTYTNGSLGITVNLRLECIIGGRLSIQNRIIPLSFAEGATKSNIHTFGEEVKIVTLSGKTIDQDFSGIYDSYFSRFVFDPPLPWF